MNAASSGYFIHQDPDGLFVEAWSAWHLPFMALTPDQSRYRDELRRAIKCPGASRALHATYTSQNMRPGLDVENVLFYNVGTSVFREAAKDALRFEMRKAPTPDPPILLNFAARHHVRYQVAGTEARLRYAFAGTIAAQAHVSCVEVKEFKDVAALWKSFKTAMTISPEANGLNGSPLAIQIIVSASAKHRVNFADVMKPLADAFTPALHYYRGIQLTAVVDRLSMRLRCSPEVVQELLLHTKTAVLGPRAVPHLRGEGLQWSPSDDLLVAGEFFA